jgi:diphthine-ammonia ligase
MELDLKVYAPYWQKPHEELIKEALDAGFEILMVGTYADGLDEKWLGRKLDYEALDELKKLNKKFGIDIGGEGGEYETFVLDGPIFKKKLVVEKARKQWDGIRGEYIIEKIKLEKKQL